MCKRHSPSLSRWAKSDATCKPADHTMPPSTFDRISTDSCSNAQPIATARVGIGPRVRRRTPPTRRSATTIRTPRLNRETPHRTRGGRGHRTRGGRGHRIRGGTGHRRRGPNHPENHPENHPFFSLAWTDQTSSYCNVVYQSAGNIILNFL